MGKVIALSKGTSARNAVIAKIHVAKKQLAMADDSYRAMLKRVTGKESASALTDAQLERVLAEFKKLGFSGKPKRAGSRKMTEEAQARKIRALWLNLWHLGELRDSSETALAKYCKRMCGVDALQWMTARECDMVIRALRGWLERIGWFHPDEAYVSSVSARRFAQKIDPQPEIINYTGLAAKALTIRMQYALIGQSLGEFVPELMPAEEMDNLIEHLGPKCRAVKGENNHGRSG